MKNNLIHYVLALILSLPIAYFLGIEISFSFFFSFTLGHLLFVFISRFFLKGWLTNNA